MRYGAAVFSVFDSQVLSNGNFNNQQKPSVSRCAIVSSNKFYVEFFCFISYKIKMFHYHQTTTIKHEPENWTGYTNDEINTE